ncbi:MAG TPA: hypothetical protein PK031_01205 [Pseudomonadales bacterium]|nr:hypothetical protein [Pseudomonadales bacterium]
MPINDPRQIVALSGIIAALFFSFSYVLIFTLYFPFTMPVIESPIDKIVFFGQNSLFAALTLAGGLSAVTIRKMFQPGSLDGDPIMDGSRLDIHIRYTRDTAHHLIIFIVMLFNLVFLLEGVFLRLAPVLTSWFIFSRLYYWGAYLISPPHRIFGAVATLTPTIFFLWVIALRIMGWPIF